MSSAFRLRMTFFWRSAQGAPRQKNGGGGNRTPVRECLQEAVYLHSRSFVFTRPAPSDKLRWRYPVFSFAPDRRERSGTIPHFRPRDPTPRAGFGPMGRLN